MSAILTKPLVSIRGRELDAYPSDHARRAYQLLVVAITVALYYELYVGGGVATLMLAHFHMSFAYLVVLLAIGNLAGAFASLFAGICDRFGRANLIVYGLLVVGVLTEFAIPNAPDRIVYGIEYGCVAVVEGIILVATPALMRDFSPQVGRATAMGIWSIGSVIGSLLVSLTVTLTLARYQTWQSQFQIAGAIGLLVFGVAFLFLRELSPRLRDQIMVSLHDRALVEVRARNSKPAFNPKASFRELLHLDVIGSAVGLSLLLLPYYTTIAFGTIFFVTIFHFSLSDANALFNWSWALDAVALIVAGILSDRLRVRKPFMLIGSLGQGIVLVLLLLQITHRASWGFMVFISCLQASLGAFAYAAWMASYTETLEARNPALVATGLAISGWINRLVVTAAFLVIPYVVTTVTPLIESGPTIAAFAQARAAHVPPSPTVLANMALFQHAQAVSPGQWQLWWWVCAAGMLVFAATIFLMRGRWSPAASRADIEAHDRAVAREMARLASVPGAG